jgi:ribosomal subunit interface protein
MKIQFNTDKSINGDERHEEYFSSQIAKKLERFENRITRIEVFLTDENGKKAGHNDIVCKIEARVEGKNPITVSEQADSMNLAISGAIDKLKAALETVVGRMQNH